MTKRKLLQLNVTANWGSTGRIAEGVGRAAMDAGWESRIVYGRHSNPSQSELVKAGGRADLYSHYFMSRFLDREGLGSKQSTIRLIDEIEAYNPDLIQLHNIHDHWLNYPLLFRWLASTDVPVVWTMHDCWAFTGGCFHFVNKNCTKWQRACGRCPQRHHRIDATDYHYRLKSELFVPLQSRMTITSVSGWLDRQVQQSFFGNNRHCVIYNGVDTDVFRPTEYNAVEARYNLKNRKVLLGVSNVWPESKGLRYFLELRNMLSDEYVIVLVGLKPKAIKELPQGVIGIPRTNDVQELAALYTRSHAVLSLSEGETFGLTLAEGMACGTPAIGFDTTAISEIIDPGTGMLVPFGNVSALVEAVETLERAPLSAQACREKVVTNFNTKVQYRKYIDLYEDILKNKH